MENEKQACLNALRDLLVGRIETLQDELKEVIASRDNESKSSAGDKYETGRAMMQLRQEQLEKQLAEQKKNLSLVKDISSRKTAEKIGEGSYIRTNHGMYLIAIGLGPVIRGTETFYSISLASPFGQIIRGLEVNDQFKFREKSYIIKEVA